MNKTEQLAKEWLMRHGYTEDDIIFQSATSPDFILSDGKSIEVKKVNNHTLAIYQSQWEQLQAQADCSIAIFNNISIEPLAVISVCEINPPLFKKNGYVIKIKDDGMEKWRRHLQILSQLRGMHFRNRSEFWGQYHIIKGDNQNGYLSSKVQIKKGIGRAIK